MPFRGCSALAREREKAATMTNADRLIRLAAAMATAACAGSAAAQPISVGVATDDVWGYVSAINPATNTVLSVWGLPPDTDINPAGFPASPGGPPTGANFYSHAFLGWRLANLPANYRWGGATITVTLASDTWQPAQSDAFIRYISRGFDQATWSTSNTPVPLAAPGRITGNDSGATGQGTTITFTIPGTIDPAQFRPWFTGGQVFLAITANGSPQPPSQPGQPPDLTGALQIYSREDIFGRGPRLTLLPGRLGDANGDGRVDFLDLNLVLADYGQSGPALCGDVNNDGVVDFFDLNEVLGNYGQ